GALPGEETRLLDVPLPVADVERPVPDVEIAGDDGELTELRHARLHRIEEGVLRDLLVGVGLAREDVRTYDRQRLAIDVDVCLDPAPASVEVGGAGALVDEVDPPDVEGFACRDGDACPA